MTTLSAATIATDDHSRRAVALRELSDADRAYRSAFIELTSRGGLEPSSFVALIVAVDRLRDVIVHLHDQDEL